MGKVLKYCAACEEGFAEKFGFCPNCGASLTAFEMNPVEAVSDEPDVEAPEANFVEATVSGIAVPTAEHLPAATTRSSATGHSTVGYRVTVVEEKNVKQRNMLLLGAFVLGTVFLSVGFVYSMFNKYLDVTAIETPELFTYVSDVDPTAMDPVEEMKKADKKDGGGGGGNEDEDPASKGREADQSENPLFKPSVTYDKVTNPALAIKPTTLGTKDFQNSDDPYGLRNSTSLFPSDGPGTDGGQGKGRNGGQGDDIGPGLGPGTDGGTGGNGKRPGGGIPDEEIPQVKKPVGPTVGVKILSKPRANYTDSARENVVQGKVVLRVTFLASGQIGTIIAVSGLPYGLTEQAIVAARAIRFEPAKQGGVAVSVTKTIEYSFTIF